MLDYRLLNSLPSCIQCSQVKARSLEVPPSFVAVVWVDPRCPNFYGFQTLVEHPRVVAQIVQLSLDYYYRAYQ